MALRHPMSNRRARNPVTDAGLTLVEMVVALGIITVLLLSAGGALVSLQSTQKFGEATDRANQLAADRIEQIRKVPWEKMGMNPSPPAAPTSPAFPNVGETLVQFTTAGQAPAVLAPVVTDATTKVEANQFTVYTRVTWVPVASVPSITASDPKRSTVIGNASKFCRNNITGAVMTCGSDDGIPDDAAKRITMRIQWKDGTRTRVFDFSTLRYPTIAEAIPVALLQDNQTATRGLCDRPASTAWCTLSATQGTVLAASSGTYKTTIPVTMTGVSRADLTSASATLTSGNRAPVVHTLANPSGDKRTWTKTFPVGTVQYPSSTATLRFGASAGAADTLLDVAWWAPMTAPISIVPAAGTDWIGSHPGSLRADVPKTDPSIAPVGNENTAQDFCVKPDGTLWNHQSLFFDVGGIDNMDGASTEAPTVIYSGANDAARAANAVSKQVSPAWVGHPSGALTGAATANTGGTGAVGATLTAPGSTNTLRWYAAFPGSDSAAAQRTVFDTATTRSVITVAQTRPGDGVTAQTYATIPIRVEANRSDCNVLPPLPPANVVASATGTSVTVTWDAAAYATGYRVLKATQTTPADPLTYSLAAVTTSLSYTTTAPAGTNVTFYITATNEHGISNRSDTASAATTPLTPPGTVSTSYGNYFGLFENTTLSQESPWTTFTKMYRTIDGGTLTYMMDGTTYGDGVHYFNRGGSPGPAPGHDYVYSVSACNAAGCSARKSGPVERVPLWYGLSGTGGGIIFDWDPLLTGYGSTGAYDFATAYASGSDISFSRPPAFGRATGTNTSALFNANGNIRQFAAYSAGPAANAPRSIGFMYREASGVTAGWLFGRAGTTTTNGFSAKNTATGTIVMNGTTSASWTGLKINDLAWHYYIFSYDGTNVTLYEDGVSKGAKALVVNTPTSSDLTFNRADGQTPVTGVSAYYEFMNYWNKAVSATEALDFYNGRAD